VLLRRITKHVKDQNWFAVALDFIVVVVGILIAFQISSMAERRGEIAKFDRQMQALKIEMIENSERYEITLKKIENQLAGVSRLREILADPEIEVTDSEIDLLLYRTIGVIGVFTKRSSLDAALSSELFAESNPSELIDAVERWEEKLSQLNRVQQDALRFRDSKMHAYFTENLAYASVFAVAGLANGQIAPSKVGNSRVELSDDRTLDNILAGRQLSTLQDITYTRELAMHASEIIRLIEKQSSYPDLSP